MTRPIRIACKITDNALKLALRRVEAAGVEVKGLDIEKDAEGKPTATIALVDNVAAIPPPIVAVVYDPPGTAPQPGDSLVCRGPACINGNERRVAVYRR